MTERLLYDARGAAEMLSMSTRSLERLAASGELPSVKLSGLRRYRAADLAAFVAGLGDGATVNGNADRHHQPVGVRRRHLNHATHPSG